jgi:thiamine biosynthesis lipoprotein
MNRKSKISLTALAAVAVLLSASWMRSIRKPEPLKRTQIALGTFVEIEVRDMPPREAELAMNAAFQEVQRIHREFSPFNESGSLWRANHEESETVTVGRELYDLLLVCDAIHKKTNGAFDPAMEALFRVWRIWGEHPVVPSDETVQSARALSGWDRIRLDGSLKIARKPGVEISFGAIAKGYAVDRMTEILMERGVNNALVNAGGEIRTLGQGWVVGIQHPSIREELVQEIRLPGMAVATSGDYKQYHEEKGKRYHHILDPATGYPATDCRSVTVIAGTCIEADAYATGVFVLGPALGMDLINRIPGMEAMIIDRSDMVFRSDGFDNYLRR